MALFDNILNSKGRLEDWHCFPSNLSNLLEIAEPAISGVQACLLLYKSSLFIYSAHNDKSYGLWVMG